MKFSTGIAFAWVLALSWTSAAMTAQVDASRALESAPPSLVVQAKVKGKANCAERCAQKCTGKRATCNSKCLSTCK